MGKKVQNPVEVQTVATESGIETSIHFGATCEYGDLPRRGMTLRTEPLPPEDPEALENWTPPEEPPEGWLTQADIDFIEQFMLWAYGKLLAHDPELEE